jgi:murein DD-endopeptidase MepM/ murein hydrolase activator NlpD
MAWTTTRAKRAGRWRSVGIFAAATIALSGFLAVAAEAQVKPPTKPSFRTAKTAPKVDPNDSHADDLNAKWLSEHNKGVENNEPANAAAAANTPQNNQKSAGKAADKPIDKPVDKPAEKAVPADDERFSSIPGPAAPVGNGARALVTGTVKLVKANTAEAAFKQLPGGANLPALKDVVQAFAGFAPATASAAKVEVIQGRTADGMTRPLYVALNDGKTKQSYWWFAPSDQPEGWFDEQGKRLGGTALAEPKPGSRISSPFGRRTYYGRSTSSAFHNGIDFEGKHGEPIYAAADGTISHMNWYFNYGRTVKITHADNFETLYAHMSRFVPGLGPGSHVRKGDLIGYVGSTGRSTGPHLHFSAIANGQFVDPQPYLSEAGNGQLGADTLVSFRAWQQEIRTAASPAKSNARGPYHNLQGGENWTRNPFDARNIDRM